MAIGDAFETLDEAPPNDGKTIENESANDPLSLELLPPSKLPPGQLFDVLQNWCRSDIDHHRAWKADAKEWFGFRAGEHWTEQDKAILRDQNRPVIVFNRVLTILKAVAGMEINGRHEIHYIPRGTEDTAVNEVLTGASKWMADLCDGEDEESQAFDHCATCGLGFVENRMDYSEDSAGLYKEESINPLEMIWDKSAQKKNLADAQRMGRAKRVRLRDALRLFKGKARWQIDAQWAYDLGLGEPVKSIEEKRVRDENNSPTGIYDDNSEVTVVEIQWIEHEDYYLVADVFNNRKTDLTPEQYRVFEARMKQMGMPVHAVRLSRKVYKRAFLGNELLAVTDAPIKGRFSWDAITGEFDAVHKSWFGLVKIMRDPQMWANKWLSQILHLLNASAKGGILAERDAFDDAREAEETYAQHDQITWVANGSLSGAKPKIMPKPGTAITDGYVGLLTFAVSSIKDVTGINLELLGQQDQNQPGVLEAMRKQAGMTVLATLFDALRRFRKGVGRARLFFIQTYLSDGRLIRITSGDGNEQAVKLALDKTTGEYDVKVDDTPTSPNQKEQNWAIIQPLLAVFKDQLMAQPEILAILLEYSPLPARIVSAIKTFIDRMQNDPQAKQEAEQMKQLGVAQIIASIGKDQSTANLNNAKAGGAEANAMYDIAMARNMLEDNNREGLRGMFDMWEGQAKVITAQAKAREGEAKADAAHLQLTHQRQDSETKREDATTKRLSALGKIEHDRGMREIEHGKMQNERVGLLIDHRRSQTERMTAGNKMRADTMKAIKDRVQAHRIQRTPINVPTKAAGA